MELLEIAAGFCPAKGATVVENSFESLRISIASAILPELTHRIDDYAWILRPANVIVPAA